MELNGYNGAEFDESPFKKEQEVEIPIDSIVEEVREQLLNRAKYGFIKYKTNLDRRDLSTEQWINNAIEEALDFALYLTKLKKELNGNK